MEPNKNKSKCKMEANEKCTLRRIPLLQMGGLQAFGK